MPPHSDVPRGWLRAEIEQSGSPVPPGPGKEAMPHFALVTVDGDTLGAVELGRADWPNGSIIYRLDHLQGRRRTEPARGRLHRAEARALSAVSLASFHFAPSVVISLFVGTPPDPPKQRTSPEPPKRKLIAWIWWKLAEPPPGGEESEPGGGFFYPRNNDNNYPMNNDNGEFGYRP